MVKTDKKFKITSQLKKDEKIELNENGTLSLKGIASTTNRDLYGDRINEECMVKMKEKAGNLNIHADHIYDLNDVIGTITNVIPTDDNSLAIEFNIIPSIAPKIKELLDTGVKLGLSIGGSVKDYQPIYNTTNEIEGWEILDIDLYEISLTPLPANWDTYGTVTKKGIIQAKCIAGACEIMRKKETQSELSKIQKEIESIKLEMERKEKEITEDSVINIFNEMAESLKTEILDTVKSEVKKELEQFKDLILNEINQKNTETKEDAIVSELKSITENFKTLLEENTENVKKEVEGEFLKNIEEKREPEAKEIKTKSSQSLIESRTMNRHDLAAKMASKRSTNPFVNILQDLQSE